MLPLLISCDDPAARDLINLIGECGSAKEVIMAVQEAAEKLERAFEEDSDGEDEDESKIGSPKPHRTTSNVGQLKIMLELYASGEFHSVFTRFHSFRYCSVAIPRTKLRRKSASETIRPLFKELEHILQISGSRASCQEARTILSSTALLARSIHSWCATLAGDDGAWRVIAFL